jgi:hypothetical protein
MQTNCYSNNNLLFLEKGKIYIVFIRVPFLREFYDKNVDWQTQ